MVGPWVPVMEELDPSTVPGHSKLFEAMDYLLCLRWSECVSVTYDPKSPGDSRVEV